MKRSLNVFYFSLDRSPQQQPPGNNHILGILKQLKCSISYYFPEKSFSRHCRAASPRCFEAMDAVITDITHTTQHHDLRFAIANALILRRPLLCLYEAEAAPEPHAFIRSLSEHKLAHRITFSSYTAQTLDHVIKRFLFPDRSRVHTPKKTNSSMKRTK